MPASFRVKFTKKRVVVDLSFTTALKTLAVLLVSIASYAIPLPGADSPGPRVCLVIFIAAAALWITELIPSYATGIMVIVSCVYLLGDPVGGAVHDGREAPWQMYLNPIASPVLVLFFGGLVLAKGATKHGFDVRLARAFITPFGARPRPLLLGVIGTTALFSMFMSNTACTAMMLAVAVPLFDQMGDHARVRKMIVLAIPFAANIGGMGTIIGTPPNAVAASVLELMGGGARVTFLGWMIVAAPIMVVLLVVLWLVLIAVFRPGREPLPIRFPDTIEVTPGLVVVVVTFTTTILLWLMQPLHGIPSAVVAMLPVAVFTSCGIITRDDLSDMSWDVLILLAGGLTLGVAMRSSGLSEIIVAQVPFHVLPPAAVLGLMLFVTLVLSNFMSHTSASNLIIPIATALPMLSPRVGAMSVALSATLAMSLPISTPPNAMAFATRTVTTGEMARCGTVVSLAGLALLIGTFALLGPQIAAM